MDGLNLALLTLALGGGCPRTYFIPHGESHICKHALIGIRIKEPRFGVLGLAGWGSGHR